jgi:hypothetical protein
MLSIHRIAATATVAAALCVPATAAADDWYKDGSAATGSKYTLEDGRAPDRVAPAEPAVQTTSGDRLTPDRVGGIPSDNPVVPVTRIVEVPQTGFEWGDAAIGGAATLALILLLAGGAMTVRPRRAAAPSS